MKIPSWILYLGGAFAAYELFLKPTGSGASNPLSALQAALSQKTAAPAVTPTATNPNGLYGINSGQVQAYGNHNSVSNYQQLVQAIPQLANPNYQLSPAEAQQYLNNYLDLQEGLASWPGGLSQATLQKHWTEYGVRDQRIFIPLLPPSNVAYTPPPAPPPKPASGSSWFSSALSAVTAIAPYVVAIAGVPHLTQADKDLVLTAAPVTDEILQIFYSVSPDTVKAICDKQEEIISMII